MSSNLQVQRTKKWLFEALIRLMREQPFKKIGIQDVVKEAELSRSAFYSHYSSKEDILCEKIQEYQDEAVAVSLSCNDRSQFGNWKRTIEVYLKYAEFYELLHKNGLDSLVYQAEMENYSGTTYLVSQTLQEKAPEDTSLYYGVYVPYHRPSQINLILKWISDGAPTPIDEIAALVSSLACIHVFNAFQEDYRTNLSRISAPKTQQERTDGETAYSRYNK